MAIFGIFMTIFHILWPLSYIFSRFGTLHQDKSGNPGANCTRADISQMKPFDVHYFSRGSATRS
jgi:hypothetical protein